jgi:hypothetical protein
MWCGVLWCVVLWCDVLCCVVLCCVVLLFVTQPSQCAVMCCVGGGWWVGGLCGGLQGAVLSLYSGLQSPHTLGGIIALSGYLPDASNFAPRINDQVCAVCFVLLRFTPTHN